MSRSVILAGAAAGVAAAFNTPLAGIVFAIEEMARSFEHRYSSVVLTAIIFAGAASLSILGNYSYFGYAVGGFDIGRDLVAIVVIGGLGGFLGGLFARTLIDGGKCLYGVCQKRNLHHPAIFAALCGLIIAFLGLVTKSATFGTGYELAKGLLHGESTGSWLYTAANYWLRRFPDLAAFPAASFRPAFRSAQVLALQWPRGFPQRPWQAWFFSA